MEITVRYMDEERALDVPEGISFAEAAEREGIQIFGNCHGQNQCTQCSRRVRQGLEKLLKKDGTHYVHPEGCASFVRTCQVTVKAEGVSIDADDRARRW